VEPHSLAGQLIDVRRLYRLIAIAAQISITLIIRDKDDDIRSLIRAGVATEVRYQTRGK